MSSLSNLYRVVFDFALHFFVCFLTWTLMFIFSSLQESLDLGVFSVLIQLLRVNACLPMEVGHLWVVAVHGQDLSCFRRAGTPSVSRCYLHTPYKMQDYSNAEARKHVLLQRPLRTLKRQAAAATLSVELWQHSQLEIWIFSQVNCTRWADSCVPRKVNSSSGSLPLASKVKMWYRPMGLYLRKQMIKEHNLFEPEDSLELSTTLISNR